MSPHRNKNNLANEKLSDFESWKSYYSYFIYYHSFLEYFMKRILTRFINRKYNIKCYYFVI